MPSIGELFIQLAVMGNANELKNANKELQKANILTQKQTKLEKARAEALERIQKAQSKQEKREIVKQYRAKKEKIEQEANLRLSNLEAKATQKSIAQWATYAHAVSMASSIVVGSLKKIYSEIEKVASYGQNMINIGMTTSEPIKELQKYGRVGEVLNDNITEQQIMSQMAKWNQAYELYKTSGDTSGFSWDIAKLSQLGAGKLIEDVLGKNVKNVGDYFEVVRQLLQGKTPENQANILSAAGIDQNLLPMLLKSREDFERLAAETQRDAQSEDELKQQAEYRKDFKIFKKHFEDFLYKLTSELSPIFKQILAQLDAYLPILKQDIVTFMRWMKDNIKKEDIQNLIIVLNNLYDIIKEWVGRIADNVKKDNEIKEDIKDKKEEGLKENNKEKYVEAATQEAFMSTGIRPIIEGLWKLQSLPVLKQVTTPLAALVTGATMWAARDTANKEYNQVINNYNNINQNNSINDRDTANQVVDGTRNVLLTGTN